MNLNDEFNSILNDVLNIQIDLRNLYNEPMPFNQILSNMYELEEEIDTLRYELIDFRDKHLEGKKNG